MYQKIEIQQCTVHQWESSNANLLPIIMLHGFMGTGMDFQPLSKALGERHSLYALDLMESLDDLDECGVGRLCATLKTVIELLCPREYLLLGYSLGGRVALHCAKLNPRGLAGLILVGANPGIEDPDARACRCVLDEQWVEKILKEGVVAFTNAWQAQPLIATQRKNMPAETYQAMLDRRYEQSPDVLVSTLRAMSPGIIPSVWSELPNLNYPFMLVAGEEDPKYTQMNERMQFLIPQSDFFAIPNAGHMAHLENMPAFVNVFNQWYANHFTP